LVATTLFARIGRLAMALGLAPLALAAQPALANTSAAAADVTAPVQENKQGGLTGDAQFRQLFAQWRALDGTDDSQTTNGVPAPITGVSVPSRMPLEDARMSSNFGMRNHPVLGGRRNHQGIDLAAPTGTPVYATADGIVSRADWFSSYGLYISIEHGGEMQTRYAHLSRLAVADGERVRKGQIIGYVGSTGRSTGPHLHYEVRVAGAAVNPVPYMVETEAQQALALANGAGGQGGAE
jgi:murein DD-endopeptidase MepM/ murein hydrolase activator NlpD